MNEAFISVDQKTDQIDEINLSEQNKQKLESILEDKGIEQYEIDSIVSGIQNQIDSFNKGTEGLLNILSSGKINTRNNSIMDYYIDKGVSDFTGDYNEGTSQELNLFKEIANNFNNKINNLIESIDKDTLDNLYILQESISSVLTKGNIDSIIENKRASIENHGTLGILSARNKAYEQAFASIHGDSRKVKY